MLKYHQSLVPELLKLSLQQPMVILKCLPAWPWSPSESDVGLPLLFVPEDTNTYSYPAFSPPQAAQ